LQLVTHNEDFDAEFLTAQGLARGLSSLAFQPAAVCQSGVWGVAADRAACNYEG
jgi:hypothetical protein